MPVYLYLSSVSLQLNAFMHFRTETNFACVCVCVHTPDENVHPGGQSYTSDLCPWARLPEV